MISVSFRSIFATVVKTDRYEIYLHNLSVFILHIFVDLLIKTRYDIGKHFGSVL